MPDRPLRWRVIRALHRVGVLDNVETAQVLWRYLCRIPHERDFRYFKRHNNTRGGLFLDVGANIGQTALSLSIFRPDLRIMAFEPNPALATRLRLVQRVLGNRMTIRMTGASDHSATQSAYLPRVCGVPFLQELTMDRTALDAAETRERFRNVVGLDYPQRFQVDEIQMRFEALDTLNLTPDIVKIDVQGCESIALAGMRATLERCRPLLMIEADVLTEARKCVQFLNDLGYRPSVYDAQSDTLRPWDGTSTGINLFFTVDPPRQPLGQRTPPL